jgi:hypothetical protein
MPGALCGAMQQPPQRCEVVLVRVPVVVEVAAARRCRAHPSQRLTHMHDQSYCAALPCGSINGSDATHPGGSPGIVPRGLMD